MGVLIYRLSHITTSRAFNSCTIVNVHILLIHQAFASIGEPGGTRHHELARYLVSQGHQITVIASPISYLTGVGSGRARWSESRVDDVGVKIIKAWTLPALHRSFVWRVLAFLSFMISSFIQGLAVRKVDLIWGTSPPIFQGITAWLLARIKRVPFLFEVRDLWPDFAVAVGVLNNRVLIALARFTEKFLYRHADHVMVNSPGYIAHVQNRGAKKISLIPNGADPGMFDPNASGQAFREQYGLEEKFIVMYAGAHGMSNDLGVVLNAAHLLGDIPDLQFAFLGDGKEKAHLVKFAEELKLENVLFVPPLAKEQIKNALAAADACLATLKPIELYKTTFPNKVFDYMAAGRAVLLGIDGVIRTVVEEAKAGLFFQPGNTQALMNAVQSLMADRAACTQMGLNGRNYIEKYYSRAQIAGKFNDLLLSLLRKNG